MASVGITKIARVSQVAGDENLRSDVDIGPGGLPGDLDSVGEGGGCSVGPAGATVLRDMLVSNVG